MIKKIAVVSGAAAFLLVFFGATFLGIQWMSERLNEDLLAVFAIGSCMIFVVLTAAVSKLISDHLFEP
jgi:hypothetical protein